ncbi:response regulator [Paenibacillus sp. GSMTC-2017]|uniref:response regulator transcription factor n=1 Tax=Paenibacillus sp. GSMTC-2017 TaxID=2794350 RepID=UPI0018DA276A|nr:helix-turn-helix domain-containing protein [Paenibacillus sp. GSMTC-2017]MBH5319692.1 response regulator [Paenibacillus sp. GSMTC-2017]
MKLLIIDDEVIIRSGLSTVIQWEENGFTLLEPAASAEEALMRIPVEKPDIILTDIQMTGKTGLELASEVKREYPDTEIFILSGYEEFAYAQQAMREGISDYLLKTSRPGDIMAAALRAKKRIEEKRAATLEGKAHQTAFRWKLLKRLLHSDSPITEREAEEVLVHYPELRIASDWESLELWLISSAGTLNILNEPSVAVEDAEDVLRVTGDCAVLDWDNGWLLIFREGQPGATRRVRSAIQRAERATGNRYFAASGTPVKSVLKLREALKSAEQAAAFHWIASDSGIIAYEEIKHRKGMRTVCSQEEEQVLVSVLRSSDSDRLQTWITNTLAFIRHDLEATPGSMISYLHSFLVAGFRWLERAAESVGQSAQKLPQLEGLNMKKLSIEPEEVMVEIMSAIIAQYERLAGGSGSRNTTIERTLTYIREHLDQSLTLSQVAATVHMNPNYFSELFKKETGKNYIEFVTEARIEWAIRLLRETPAKVSEIAKRVGYEDMKHFNKLFKRYTGETPSYFRSEANR